MAFAALAGEIGGGRTSEEVADGFVRIAVENMANAIKKISVQRGYDVTRYALNCFGGAGGQHACMVADALGMTTVLIHPLSSLLSAYGMGLAEIRATRQQALEEPFGDDALAAIDAIGTRLGADARAEVAGQGVADERSSSTCARTSATPGTDTALLVDAGDAVARDNEISVRGRAQGAVRVRRREQELVVEAMSVEAVGGGATFAEPELPLTASPLPAPLRTSRFFSGGAWHDARDLHPRAACARASRRRSRDHHRAASDHRGRGRLAGRDHAPKPSRARRARRRPRASRRSAPAPIR